MNAIEQKEEERAGHQHAPTRHVLKLLGTGAQLSSHKEKLAEPKNEFPDMPMFEVQLLRRSVKRTSKAVVGSNRFPKDCRKISKDIEKVNFD